MGKGCKFSLPPMLVEVHYRRDLGNRVCTSEYNKISSKDAKYEVVKWRIRQSKES